LAPLLVPLAIWIYAFVFAFASLWFTHYLLRALDVSRQALADAAPTQQHVIDVQARHLP
jgi:hypothetical protein